MADQTSIPPASIYPSPSFAYQLSTTDLVNGNGPRIPSHAMAQKDFRIATIVLSAAVLSTEEMRFLDYFTLRAEGQSPVCVKEGFSEYVAHPFNLATNGLGTLNTSITAIDGCHQKLFLPILTAGFTEAQELIVTSGSVDPNDTVFLHANEVKLTSGFEVSSGGYLVVAQEGCEEQE